VTDDPLVVVERYQVAERAQAAVLRLNRPGQLNAIDAAMLTELDAAVESAAADPSVRVLLVTGAGRAFSAGGDLKKYIELQRDPVAFPRFVAEFHRVTGRLRTVPQPVVALVNGVTAAGGLELVLNCDIALVAASATIGDAHLNVGQMGGGGVLTLLPRAVGRAKAAELVFGGRLLSAAEAVDWGLASRVVDDGDLLAAGLAFAEEVARKSPLAVATAKEVMHTVSTGCLPVDAGLAYERSRNAFYCLTSRDAPEGLRAFAERRPPRFEGR
jgi:enoyl-CoA hydratase/carnithine racemase